MLRDTTDLTQVEKEGEMQEERELTIRFQGEPYLQNNGLGRYSLVRDLSSGRLQHASNCPENVVILSEAVSDMQKRRAGGYFGTDDDSTWYPMRVDLARRIRWELSSGDKT